MGSSKKLLFFNCIPNDSQPYVKYVYVAGAELIHCEFNGPSVFYIDYLHKYIYIL